MKKLTVSLHCCLCSEKHEVAVEIPDEWASGLDGTEAEERAV
jgi:hypothetical protein